ncbi:AAA family ATPase [Streptomyces sp. NPDC006540]|uniref:AAA family ATPase n=1 Tax=Streptomyces sp. NPDC006540 TaxID=3155353 RepID=UPI0033AB2FC7
MTDTITHPQPDKSASHASRDERFRFTAAARHQRYARIMLDGAPGAGTTYTALALTTSIGTRVAVIDTQRGKAKAYADVFPFDACPPLAYCSPSTLITALAHCADQGYDTVVIATLSHFWSGPGGVLEQVGRAAKRGASGSWSGWREVRPIERHMLDALLGYPGHVVVTVRDKLTGMTAIEWPTAGSGSPDWAPLERHAPVHDTECCDRNGWPGRSLCSLEVTTAGVGRWDGSTGPGSQAD